MRKIFAAASLALAFVLPSPSIANGWVRNPTDLESDAAIKQNLWTIRSPTDSQDDPIRTFLFSPWAVSPTAIASIATGCGSSKTSVLLILRDEKFIAFGGDSLLAAKVDGVRYSLPVEHETWDTDFEIGARGHQLFRRAIREELPVLIAVPIYQEQAAFFEWDMKGGAAAWKEACTIKP